MDEKLLGIGIVFILASMLYIAGLFGQRACYLSESDDASVQGKGIWRYLFGLSSAGRIYLRFAFAQGLGIAYFVLGIGGVLLFGMRIVKPLTNWVFLGGMVLSGIIWIGVDVWARIAKR